MRHRRRPGVAACYSARSSPIAREAGVWTEEAWRGRSFGTLVVAAWRNEVVRTGAQPLYSTSWDNAASLALARRLGLHAYAETVSFH
jgi:predicted GNAT family acetyltransferase